jgi:hypothetical protein
MSFRDILPVAALTALLLVGCSSRRSTYLPPASPHPAVVVPEAPPAPRGAYPDRVAPTPQGFGELQPPPAGEPPVAPVR